ncbi:hypothetical protein PR202_ga28753 [Eleusine coracana subsp. coracana]|uniref:Uncharacterized protein n=1 Tax=Eleusine coracana subsp. coracana TaxID=191504 RepID=A0AAV5DK06_ELECO|nr:hypothetical protein PR202_ga28753 [Eleusine coracana subsp. coracana]
MVILDRSVSARQAYMKGIVVQSSDNQYWDIWNRQKLSPEFEVKRQNILKANQNLTNQLVELERHFNNLEMNKFGEAGRVASNRRPVYSNKSRSSQAQLSSVYNALNSQLAAAEQLSECLSKQISTLNIDSPSTKRGAVTKELFDSIENLLIFQSLASLEPQKTTVKRIAQQQRLKISSDLPFRSNKKIFDSQMDAISLEKSSPTSSIVESYVSRLQSPSEVDSICWVRDDSIVIGCVRLIEDNEEGYLIQVIKSEENSFLESSSKPVVYSYLDFFHGIMDDIVPSGVGPNLLLGYLHRWDLMVASNKKSIDEHIALLKWPSTPDDEKTVIYLEMLEDKYSPRIDLQENGDDNVILGFGVENVSLFQKITVTVGPEQKEVSPQHILLCLTGEGKLVIYYLARISDPSDLPQTTLSTIEDSYGEKQISVAAVSEKELTPSVTNSVSKSSNHQGSIDVKNNSSVSKSQETVGSSLFTSFDKKPMDTKQVNVTTPLTVVPSLALTGSTKPAVSSSFSTVNSVDTGPKGSKESSALASSSQPSIGSGFGSNQLVSARQAYMKGIVVQSSDTQYWDIWNRQKLSPEFEVKRQNILKANQNLTNQLVELERHFNNLEMNKFGEAGRVASNRRPVYSNKSRSSQAQLSSVYNALNSQLAAAEQLSECLSKQISTLNIDSPSTKRGAVTKELFDSIENLLIFQSLASLEPQKTTVKRIAQQQRLKISSDLPFRSNKKIFDSQMAAISLEKSSPTSSIVESYVSRLQSPSEGVKAKPSGSQQNSLFKWVKESTGPSQGSEQKHFELPGQARSVVQPSKPAPSSPASFSYRGARDSVSPSNVASFGTTNTVPKSNTLTFKTTIAPKSNANTEPTLFPSMATAKTSQSPLSVRTLAGESGDASTLNMKGRQYDQATTLLGHTIGSNVSPQNKSDIFRDLSKSSFTPQHSKAVSPENTGQLSGVSDTVQHTVKDIPKVAPQPPVFSPTPVTQYSSPSMKQSVVSSSAVQASEAKTSDVLSPTVPSILPPQKSVLNVSPSVPGTAVSSSPPSLPTPVNDLSAVLNKNVSKPDVVTSEVTNATVSASMTSGISASESKSSASLPSTPVPPPKMVPTAAESVVTSTGKDIVPSNLSTDEDDMDEEAPSASTDLNLGALGGFGLGSQSSSSPQKSNPFGSSFGTSDNKSSGTPFTLTTSLGQIFRPASLNIPSAQAAQSSHSRDLGGLHKIGAGQQGAFGQPAQIQSGFGQSAQIGSGQPSGFGQPAQIGAAQQSGFGQPAQFGSQQALGSVLGSFGQSRQLGSVGTGGFGGFASASTSGGFASSSNTGFAGAAAGGGFSAAPTSGGGFVSAATGGGFAALASKTGGFAAAASSGGGFAAVAPSGSGFAAAASSGGGFAAAASSGSGFGGAAQGAGFGSGEIYELCSVVNKYISQEV